MPTYSRKRNLTSHHFNDDQFNKSEKDERSEKKKKSEREILDQFSKLPSEILHQILCYLTIDDCAVRSFLLIGRGICMSMLGISDFAYFELKRDFIDQSEYYRTLTFLTIRNVLERLTKFARKKVEMRYQDANYYEILEEDINFAFESLSVGESYYRTCKLFYRFVAAIRELNKLFPYWLTTFSEFPNESIMFLHIKPNVNLRNIYQTLIDIKIYSDRSMEYEIELDKKINPILFDSKRFSKSSNKERNWKLIFQKQLEKVKHHEFVSLVNEFNKIGSRDMPPQKFDIPLARVIELLKCMNERTRIFFLFERNYTSGIIRSDRLKRTHNFKNQFVSLHQHILFFSSQKIHRYPFQQQLNYLNLLVTFTELVFENWKQFYKLNGLNLNEREILNEFLLDGPRTHLRNISLLINCYGFSHVYNQFPTVFEDCFPTCEGMEYNWKDARTKTTYYPRYRYSSNIRK